jgi:hypothetical protein
LPDHCGLGMKLTIDVVGWHRPRTVASHLVRGPVSWLCYIWRTAAAVNAMATRSSSSNSPSAQSSWAMATWPVC